MKMILTTLLLITGTALADHSGHKVEVSINQVYIAPTGYDDNDNIQLIIDGEFPSQCYQIANTSYSVDEDKKLILVRQIARLKDTTDCRRNPLPDHLKYPTRFSVEINLGVLVSGEYVVSFKSRVNQKGEVKFKIEKAKTESTDEFIYAPVSDVFIPEMIYETQNAEVILTGVLDSLCLYWKEIDIDRFANIIVVMPKMQMASAPNQCRQSPEPLEKIVSLGEVKEGRYLLHVRSMSGKGINRMFSVIKRPGDIEGKPLKRSK